MRQKSFFLIGKDMLIVEDIVKITTKSCGKKKKKKKETKAVRMVSVQFIFIKTVKCTLFSLITVSKKFKLNLTCILLYCEFVLDKRRICGIGLLVMEHVGLHML
jgi:hypothetical protein